MQNTNKHPKYSAVKGKRKQALRLTIMFALMLTCLFGFSSTAHAVDVNVTILPGSSGGTGQSMSRVVPVPVVLKGR